MATKLKFGLLLPHFCEYGSTELCIEGAKKAEAYGFDSVWVRDHLVFEPHGMEGEDNTHIEGLLILAAISSVCKKLILGTGTVISHRHPIHLAQCMAGLSTMCRTSSWVWGSAFFSRIRSGRLQGYPAGSRQHGEDQCPTVPPFLGQVKKSATKTIISFKDVGSNRRRRNRFRFGMVVARRRRSAARRLRRLDARSHPHGDV
jgi:hypothetical protein